MKTIGILVFDEVEELDFVGPLEVFGMAARFGADCETLVIAPQPEYVRCRHGLQVVPDCILQEAPALDLLIVPSGRERTPEQIRRFWNLCAARVAR